MEFLHGELAAGETAEESATALGAEIDGQVMTHETASIICCKVAASVGQALSPAKPACGRFLILRGGLTWPAGNCCTQLCFRAPGCWLSPPPSMYPQGEPFAFMEGGGQIGRAHV